MKLLVKFLCDGKIQCENEQDCMKILKDLKTMFGFLDEDLDCQKIDNERKETNAKMAISEVATEKVLPMEIWHLIWENLDFPNRQKTCVLVCQTWKFEIRNRPKFFCFRVK